MLTKGTSICLGAAGIAFLGYCVYFDRKRRSDPLYKDKIRQKRSKERAFTQRSTAGTRPLPNPADTQAVQAYFLQEIHTGEEKLALGLIDAGVEHLFNAVSICAQPQQLLQVLQQTLPANIFQQLVRKLHSTTLDSTMPSDTSSDKSRSSSSSTEEGSSDKSDSSGPSESSSTIAGLPVHSKRGRKRHDYNMPSARVSTDCKAVLFPEQSSSCEESDAEFTELLSSILYKRQSASVISERLTKPLQQKPLFPGLAEAIERKRLARKSLRKKSRKPKRKMEIPKLPKCTYKEFIYTPIKFPSLKTRKSYPSDAWLYDSYAHILALTDVEKLSYLGNPDPGLENGLPLKYDDGRDLKFLIGELATQHTVIRPGNKLMKEALSKLGEPEQDSTAHPLTQLQPLMFDTAEVDDDIVDGDLSFGITGARFFDKHNNGMFEDYVGKRNAEMFKHSKDNGCDKKNTCRRDPPAGFMTSCRGGNRRQKFPKPHSTGKGNSSVVDKHCKRGSILDDAFMSLIRRSERSEGRAKAGHVLY